MYVRSFFLKFKQLLVPYTVTNMQQNNIEIKRNSGTWMAADKRINFTYYDIKKST